MKWSAYPSNKIPKYATARGRLILDDGTIWACVTILKDGRVEVIRRNANPPVIPPLNEHGRITNEGWTARCKQTEHKMFKDKASAKAWAAENLPSPPTVPNQRAAGARS